MAKVSMTEKTTKTPSKAKSAKLPTKSKNPPVIKNVIEKTGEELVIENFAAVSHLVGTIAETLEMLVQKTENMAYHIIATEEIIAELVATNGLDIASVNARIRSTIAMGTENLCDPAKAIDIAAAIASPLPRRR